MLVYEVLWITGCSVISAVTLSPPSAYRRATCSMEDALDYLVEQTLWKCRDRCERLTRCNAINYNLYSKLCVLQELGAAETSDDSLCVSLQINDQNTNLEGPCASKPCTNSTFCATLNTRGYACQPLFCPSPPPIQHASLMTDTPTYLGRRTGYECEKGYTGFPNPVIQCLSNRTWTSTDFVCYPNCPSIPVKASAELVTWSPHRLFANTTARYICKQGFYNLTESAIVCDTNGVWSEFECLPYCWHSDLPVLTHGSAVQGDKYTINMKAEYTCNHGYYLYSGSLFLSCGADGAWSQLDAICYKYCLVPGNPSNGAITTLPQSPYVKDSTALFTCNSGYYHYPFGQTSKTLCRSDGSWHYLAECYKECGNPPSGDFWANGRKSPSISPSDRPYTVQTTAYYECDGRNHWSGSKKKTSECDRYGNWNEPAHCCAPLAEYNASKGKCILFEK